MRSSALTVPLGCVPLLSTEFFTVRLAMVMATSQQPDCPSGGLSSFMGLPGTSMLMEWDFNANGVGRPGVFRTPSSSVGLSFREPGQEPVLLTGPLSPNFQSALLGGAGRKSRGDSQGHPHSAMSSWEGAAGPVGQTEAAGIVAVHLRLSPMVPGVCRTGASIHGSAPQVPGPSWTRAIAQALRIQRGAKDRKNLRL